MADELLVAGIVRTFAERRLPRDDTITERAVSAAVRAHLAGASAGEACRYGRELVESQARHPSSGPSRRWVARATASRHRARSTAATRC
jgi:hypothetical protein